MSVFFGADHRGFELKNKLVEYLQEKNIRVEDLGNYAYDKLDNYPEFAQKVATAVLQNPEESQGLLICGSGVGVSIAANRFRGIRCALGFRIDQIQHARENDHINVLSLPSDYISFEEAKKMVDVFLSTPQKKEEKYIRRTQQLDDITTSA